MCLACVWVCGYGVVLWVCVCLACIWVFYGVWAVWRRCHFFTEKHLVWGTFFHMQRYEKMSNYASFSASFSRLFLLPFPLLFQSVFPLLPSAFPIRSYVSPLLQKWPLSPSVTPLREISQALPPNAPAQLSLSGTGDRRLIFQSPSLDTPRFYCRWRYWAAFCRFLLKKSAFWGAVGLIIGEPLILLLLARVSGAIFGMEGGGAKTYASV